MSMIIPASILFFGGGSFFFSELSLDFDNVIHLISKTLISVILHINSALKIAFLYAHHKADCNMLYLSICPSVH